MDLSKEREAVKNQAMDVGYAESNANFVADLVVDKESAEHISQQLRFKGFMDDFREG